MPMKSTFKTEGAKVTVGVCVKNSESTIGEAVESILGQNYPKGLMELVVVDGCSRDKTMQTILDRINASSLSVKVYSENKGLGAARQIVVAKAHGDFIVWVDGDMILTKNFVNEQVEYMANHPKVGIAKGRYGIRDGVQRENIVASLENIEFLINTSSEGEIDSRKVLGTSGCIYRVKALQLIGGFDTEIKGVGEDMDVEKRIREGGWQLHVSPAVFYETRRQTWRSLWLEYSWHGSGGRYIFGKNKRAINIERMFPPWAILVELLRVPAAYRLTHRKLALFLPFHYAFKRVAWFMGFLESLAKVGK